jgi:hypothetical protein
VYLKNIYIPIQYWDDLIKMELGKKNNPNAWKIGNRFAIASTIKKKIRFLFFDVVTFESIEYERYEKENIHFFVPLTGPCMLAEKYIIDNTPWLTLRLSNKHLKIKSII